MDVCNLMKKTGDNYTEFDVVMFNVKMMDTVARPRVKTLLKQTISSENLCRLINKHKCGNSFSRLHVVSGSSYIDILACIGSTRVKVSEFCLFRFVF